jgi:hypothetical protein
MIFAYLGPFAANFAIKLKDFMVLLLAPVFLLNSWIELVNKPFPDLLAIFRS